MIVDTIRGLWGKPCTGGWTRSCDGFVKVGVGKE